MASRSHQKLSISLRLSDSRPHTKKTTGCFWCQPHGKFSRQCGEAGKATLCRSGAKFPVDGKSVYQALSPFSCGGCAHHSTSLTAFSCWKFGMWQTIGGNLYESAFPYRLPRLRSIRPREPRSAHYMTPAASIARSLEMINSHCATPTETARCASRANFARRCSSVRGRAPEPEREEIGCEVPLSHLSIFRGPWPWLSFNKPTFIEGACSLKVGHPILRQWLNLPDSEAIIPSSTRRASDPVLQQVKIAGPPPRTEFLIYSISGYGFLVAFRFRTTIFQ